ncbi:hypothetical protein G7046_g4343 [Stylonectria norvegica]|nr:hypothetical protein G7046_g4343 [Stylonectria norvegica]
MSTPPDHQPLPIFISPNRSVTPLIYFHHIIDPDLATLTVEVIGPNLSFTFTHSRAKILISRSQINYQLERKTVGFLSLTTASGDRVILASAQSGHGTGRFGDVLDPAPGVLPNRIWAKRVVAVGRILGLKMDRPFDFAKRPFREELRGIFLGSHVEVKLAVHGIYTLLDLFSITNDFDSLAELTGIAINLCWKNRLEPKIYLKQSIPGRPLVPQPRGAEVIGEPDYQDLDFGETFSSGDEDEDVVEVIPSVEPIDLTCCSRSCSPAADWSIDSYINGLAYRVGQMDDFPDGAAQAIVEFARKMRKLQTSTSQRQSSRNIRKPLPATPVMECPSSGLPQPRDRAPVSTGAAVQRPGRRNNSERPQREDSERSRRERSPSVLFVRRRRTMRAERARRPSRIEVQLPARRELRK